MAHTRLHDHSDALDGSPIAEAGVPQISIDKIKNTELQKGSDTTDASGNATVTFPNAFAAAPLVFLQGVDAGAKGIVLDVVSKTTTQAVVKARKVTGITSGAEPNHNHSFTPAGTIPAAPNHSHSFTGNALGTHRHSGSVSDRSNGPSSTISVAGPLSWSRVLYAYKSPGNCGGSCTAAFWGDVDSTNKTVASSSHTHYISDSFNTSYVSAGTPSGTIGNAGAHNHIFTGAAGTTGNAGGHDHSVDAPALTIDFDWLAVKA